MSECLHCGRPPDEGEEDRLDENASDDSLVAIARFKSSAEAGFFAHELSHTHHLPVSLIAEEHFDAAGGRQSTRFVLSAPEAVAETAARALEQLIEQTDTEETFANVHSEESQRLVTDDTTDADPEFDRPTAAMEEGTESTIHWVPIVLTLAAGSAFLWGVRHATERPGQQPQAVPAGRQQDDLWERLSLPSRPWPEQPEDARGRRELWIDRESNVVIIREDTDGDGVFEKVTPFRREP